MKRTLSFFLMVSLCGLAAPAMAGDRYHWNAPPVFRAPPPVYHAPVMFYPPVPVHAVPPFFVGQPYCPRRARAMRHWHRPMHGRDYGWNAPHYPRHGNGHWQYSWGR